ncbi:MULTISPECIES: hypothetical protein [Paraliobacillus]|uniref:hypothetical protein n=1 Tax=Paraliobacillus TaxID=200903 RepID=UPI000DD31CF7|nr:MULTISPECIES: hypothetical protein [Paraliobacillus]
MTNINKFGLLSLLMVIINFIFFIFNRGPNANITLAISIFTLLSVLGIIFALMSKKRIVTITGILLNGCIFVFAILLLLAVGIGSP